MEGGSAASVVKAFTECHEFKAANAAKLFVPPGHYYSPIVDIAEAEAHLSELQTKGVWSEVAGLDINLADMKKVWRELTPYMTNCPFKQLPQPEFRYCFSNPSYAWGDGSVLHAMLRRHRPKKLIEIGSGWSSACAVDTIEKFLDSSCRITFIEPYPQLLYSLLGDTSVSAEILDVPVQQVPINKFDELSSGDFLFIDSTHVLRTGSDVCFELFEILPRVKSGVFVHIHDMFWPFEYPRNWVIDENRSWNELYAVRAFLTNNSDWRVVFFNSYFAQLAHDEIAATYSKFLVNTGGALWLQRR